MPSIFKLPSITTVQRTGLVLGARELVFDTDLSAVYRGDGVTAGGLGFAGGAVVWGTITGTLGAQGDLSAALGGKQATLVSTTNIKTLNGSTILGAGDLVIAGVTNLSYTAATRVLASDTGSDATLPLFNATEAGLVPLSGGGTANFLRADGGWAAPPSGATNLTWAAATSTVASDTGTDAVITVADVTNPGLMTSANFTKLAGVATGATANATDASLRDRATHTGTQAVGTITGLAAVATSGSAADLSAGVLPAARFDDTAHGARAGGTLHAAATTVVAGFMASADKTKLDSVATGATANSSDATLLARANHTGTQLAATVSDFATAVAATASVTANTAKVTNATHTGDATGATALTLATVNANVGAFGTATQVAAFTVNAKGLTTAASAVAIAIPSTAVTDFNAAADARIGAASINALADVVITAPSTGQVVKYNGTNWVNDTDATGGSVYTHPNHSGDVTSVGDGAQTIAADAVTFAKMQNLSAASVLMGRGSLAGAGDPQEITLGAGLTMTAMVLSSTGGAGVTNLSYDAATRIVASDTGTDATLPIMSSANAGLVPASGGGTTTFLRADGTFAAPAGGGTPAGTTGEIQFNSAGTFGGAANVEIESGNLRLMNTTLPAAPTGATVLYSQLWAGVPMLHTIGGSNESRPVQRSFIRSGVGLYVPGSGSATVPGQLGFGAFTTTGFAATARTVAATSYFTRRRRLGFVTIATAGTVGMWRAGTNAYSIGSGAGVGGFIAVVRFGISDAASVAGARMFMGMGISTSAPTNVEPSTLINRIGMGHGAADTTMKIFYGGSVAQAPIDLGVNFPSNTLSADMYELALFAPPNQQVVNYEVTRLNTGAVATGQLTGAVGTVLPAATELMNFTSYRTNNATALAVGMDICGAYVEMCDE